MDECSLLATTTAPGWRLRAIYTQLERSDLTLHCADQAPLFQPARVIGDAVTALAAALEFAEWKPPLPAKPGLDQLLQSLARRVHGLIQPFDSAWGIAINPVKDDSPDIGARQRFLKNRGRVKSAEAPLLALEQAWEAFKVVLDAAKAKPDGVPGQFFGPESYSAIARAFAFVHVISAGVCFWSRTDNLRFWLAEHSALNFLRTQSDRALTAHLQSDRFIHELVSHGLALKTEAKPRFRDWDVPDMTWSLRVHPNVQFKDRDLPADRSAAFQALEPEARTLALAGRDAFVSGAPL